MTSTVLLDVCGFGNIWVHLSILVVVTSCILAHQVQLSALAFLDHAILPALTHFNLPGRIPTTLACSRFGTVGVARKLHIRINRHDVKCQAHPWESALPAEVEPKRYSTSKSERRDLPPLQHLEFIRSRATACLGNILMKFPSSWLRIVHATFQAVAEFVIALSPLALLSCES